MDVLYRSEVMIQYMYLRNRSPSRFNQTNRVPFPSTCGLRLTVGTDIVHVDASLLISVCYHMYHVVLCFPLLRLYTAYAWRHPWAYALENVNMFYLLLFLDAFSAA